jgi:hypothetical protein
MANILNSEFEQFGYKYKIGFKFRATTRQMKHWMAKAFSLFSGEMKTALDLWGRISILVIFNSLLGLETKIEHTRAVEELGLEFTDIDKSLIDMGYSMIKQGFMEDRIHK